MKKIILFLMVACTTFSCCNDDDNKTIAEIDKLPPLTTTGTNKAGCLVNGVAFLPKGYSPNGSNTQVYYDGESFTLSITQNTDIDLKTIGIFSNNTELHNNVSIPLILSEFANNSRYGLYTILNDNYQNNQQYQTTDLITGELKVTYHNYEEAIISGTFWFDAINSDGEKVEIREGRFDMKY
ncbi:hypothetical protein ACFS5J_06030 [Flavobacterium chuncheonense]|uniref:Lipoprotein n=1 Tax=Flavobacterium chuncheonense TaxID=2026653 RepID=A0ABW5YKL2_9FLAO